MEDSSKDELVESILTNNLQTDVKLVTEDSISWSHQCLLASLSSQLASLLSERACCFCEQASCGSVTEVVLLLVGFHGRELDNLLSYIYTGEVIVENKEQVNQLVKLKVALGLDIDIVLPDMEENDNVGDDTVGAVDTGRNASIVNEQKYLSQQLVNSIEMVANDSVVSCVRCDEELDKHSVIGHYKRHLETFTGTKAEDDINKLNTGPTMVCSRCSQKVSVAEFASHFNDHKDMFGKDKTRLSNSGDDFGEFLKRRHANKIANMENISDQHILEEKLDELLDTDLNISEYKEQENNSHFTHCEPVPISNLKAFDWSKIEPMRLEDIDMDEYNNLLRSRIKRILRDRRKNTDSKDVTEQDIDEDILKNPRNVRTEYPILRFRRAFRSLRNRKYRYTDCDTVTVEDVHAEVKREDQENFDKNNASFDNL